MQSKTSYFKTILTKNLTRFWPMWALNAFVWAIFPIALLLSGRRTYYDISDAIDHFMSPLEAAVPIYVFLYSCVVAMSVWGYLYQAKSVSLMHSLPVTRVRLFIANYVSGVIMILIPLVTAGVLLALVEIFFGAVSLKAFFSALLLTLLNVLIFFSFATLIAHITGHIFGLPALYIIFNFLAVGLGYIFANYAAELGFGYDVDYRGGANFLSPLVYIVEKVERVYTEDHMTIMPANVHILVIYAVIGLAVSALACLIYRQRRSETAGELVALRFLRPVALYSFTVCVALTGGLILASLFGAMNGRYTPNVPGVAICMIISAFIGYYVGLMLLNKKLRVFTVKSLRGILIVSALCVFFIALIKTDAAGSEKKVPDVADIKNLIVTVQGETFFIGENNRAEMLSQATDLHRKIIEAKDEIVNFDDWSEMDTMYSPNSGLTVSGYYMQGYKLHISFDYMLNNGKTLSRFYSIPVTDKIASDPTSVCNDVMALVNKPSFQLDRFRYGEEIEFDSGYVVGSEFTGLDYFDLTADQAEEVYNAVIADIMEGNYILLGDFGTGERWVYLSYTTPNDIIHYSNGDTSKFYSSFDISYNDNMTHTLDALKKAAEKSKSRIDG